MAPIGNGRVSAAGSLLNLSSSLGGSPELGQDGPGSKSQQDGGCPGILPVSDPALQHGPVYEGTSTVVGEFSGLRCGADEIKTVRFQIPEHRKTSWKGS